MPSPVHCRYIWGGGGDAQLIAETSEQRVYETALSAMLMMLSRTQLASTTVMVVTVWTLSEGPTAASHIECHRGRGGDDLWRCKPPVA